MAHQLSSVSIIPQPFTIIVFKRSPDAFKQCLLTEPTLVACRRRLEIAALQHTTELGGHGPQVFLESYQFLQVKDYLIKVGVTLRGTSATYLLDMKHRHVITDRNHYHAVLRATAGVSRRHQVIPQQEADFYVHVPVIAETEADVVLEEPSVGMDCSCDGG